MQACSFGKKGGVCRRLVSRLAFAAFLSFNSTGLVHPIAPAWQASAASMSASRYLHTSTLLPNGKVLITGGRSGASALSSAELYDPASGTFSATGSMGTARMAHTATLLPNGKVLIAGGVANDLVTTLSSAELYDPATGVFSATGSMGTTRNSHAAVLLPNGKVLIAGGGLDNVTATLSSAELYDPAAGTFSATGAMSTARQQCPGILLPNGKVLIIGGFNNNVILSSNEIYDPAAGTFSATGSMGAARWRHAAALMPNGKVLVAGGANSGGTLSSAELFDPAAGTFSATGSLNGLRQASVAVQLPNGKILITGGSDGAANPAWADLYDPTAGTFSVTNSMSSGRSSLAATLLPNGRVLVTGGHNGSAAVASADLYVLSGGTGTFSATGSMGAARFRQSGTLLPNGKVLIVGGANGGGTLSSAELYDPATGAFSATGSMSGIRQSPLAILLPNGKVLVFGGADASAAVSSAELYDPESGTFSATGSMSTARSAASAILLPNGKVLVAGGHNGASAVSSAELYDPAAGTFSGTGSMSALRYLHTATLLRNGKVLIVGGRDNVGSISSSELYDPATGTFSVTGSLAAARRFHTSTLLPTGKVLVAGGTSGSHLSSAELYDPAAGTFSATGSMETVRTEYSAILLPIGKVLVAGGWDGVLCHSSAELYDPDAGIFSVTGSMSSARDQYSVTLLPSGKVLAAGGDTCGTTTSSADLYDTPFGGPDVLSPGALSTLAVSSASYVGALTLSWSEPGNDGASETLGSGSYFYVQYSTYSGVSWSTASAQVVQSTSGVAPSSLVRYNLGGLDPGTTYYLSVWHKDEAGNVSGLSNIASSYARPFPAVAMNKIVTGDGTWHIYYGSGTAETTNGVAVDADGNTYVSGTLSNGSNMDLFVYKYDPAGNLLLSKYFNGADNLSDSGYVNVAVDTVTGSFYLAGSEHKTAPVSVNLLIKYGANGQMLWQRRAQGNSPTTGQGVYAVKLDSSGNIYTGGQNSSGATVDSCVRKYNPDGDQLWVSTKSYSGANEEVLDLYIQGGYIYASGTVDMSGSAQGQNGTIWKLDLATGHTEWTSVYNGEANRDDDLQSVVADASGNLYLVGDEQVALNDYAHLAQKRNSSGVVQWTVLNNSSAGASAMDLDIKVVLSTDNYLYSAGFVMKTGRGLDAAVSKKDLNGNLLGMYTYDLAAGTDQAWNLALDGDKLVFVGNEETGGQTRYFVRKINVSDVRFPLPAGCAQGFSVKKDGSRDFTTIQGAVNALSRLMNGDACVVIRDTQTYSEQVTVQGFTNNGYRLKIMADPTFVSSAPTVNPPAASTAAFHIMNDSVTVHGINIVSTNTVAYGIWASSASVNISSVNVVSGGKIWEAGLAISGYSSVSYSSITVQSASGCEITGPGNEVLASTITNNSADKYAYALNSDSNTIVNSYISNPSGYSVGLFWGENNAISDSTITSNANFVSALHISNSNRNNVMRSYIANPAGYGARISNAAYNTISDSTMASNSPNSALYLQLSDSNTITSSYIENPAGDGARLESANYNTISYSTMTTNFSGGRSPLALNSSSFNIVTHSHISNPAGIGADLSYGGNNTISDSTMISNASSGVSALGIYGSVLNTVTRSVISNPAG